MEQTLVTRTSTLVEETRHIRPNNNVLSSQICDDLEKACCHSISTNVPVRIVKQFDNSNQFQLSKWQFELNQKNRSILVSVGERLPPALTRQTKLRHIQGVYFHTQNIINRLWAFPLIAFGPFFQPPSGFPESVVAFSSFFSAFPLFLNRPSPGVAYNGLGAEKKIKKNRQASNLSCAPPPGWFSWPTTHNLPSFSFVFSQGRKLLAVFLCLQF